MTQFRNYKRFSEQKQRMTIIADVKGTTLEIRIAYCSPNDMFNKAKGLEVAMSKPAQYISIERDNTAHYTFMEFCKQFYKKETEQLPMRTNEILLSIKEKKQYKFSGPSVAIEFSYLTK